EVRAGGGLLDDRTAGREVAAQDGGAAPGRLERVVQGADDVAVVAGAGPRVGGGAQRLARHREGVGVQQLAELGEHRGKAAGVAAGLNQEAADGHQVEQGGGVAHQRVDVVEGEVVPEPAGDGQKVDDGVGGTADGGVHPDGVLE